MNIYSWLILLIHIHLALGLVTFIGMMIATQNRDYYDKPTISSTTTVFFFCLLIWPWCIYWEHQLRENHNRVYGTPLAKLKKHQATKTRIKHPLNEPLTGEQDFY